MLGVSKDLLPLVGRDPDMYSICYVGTGTGLPWTTAAGRYIVEHMLDGRDDYDAFFSPERRVPIPDTLHPLIGTKAAFALSNLWSKYYKKDNCH